MNKKHPVLFAVGVNHRTAPVDVRERIYLQADEIPALVKKLKKTLAEVVVLSTCNRTEIYGVTIHTEIGLDFYQDLLIDFKNAGEHVTRDHFFGSVSCAACLQLFSVATSLDSKMIGDAQILGQMRSAYSLATQHGSTGKIVNQLFQRGFKIGKRARTETELHKGTISLSSAAAEFAEKHLGSLADKTVLLIGAGDTARLSAEALIKRKVGRLIVANRTRENAVKMLEGFDKQRLDWEVIGLEDIQPSLKAANVVISSISSDQPILSRSDLDGCVDEKLLIDLGVPRNMDNDLVGIDGIHMKNVDDLNEIVDTNFQRRKASVPHTRKIILEEMTEFLVWYYSLPLLPVAMACGGKPDLTTKIEILGVKEFLMSNLSWVHKIAMNDGAETFAGHAAVVDQLVSMRNGGAQAR